MRLEEFLAARLAEDEAEAKGPPGWKLEHWTAVKYADKDSGRNWRVDAEPRCVVDAVAREDALFIARHDPARVLREVEAGRQLLASLRQAQERLDHAPPGFYQRLAAVRDAWQEAVRQRAAVWSDHPDYDPDWAPVADALEPESGRMPS